MKAADWIAADLARRGVRSVYEVIGGMTTHLIDAIHRAGVIRIVSMRHEQAAAFAVEGSARMSGIPSVAFATSGPGATNLLTGIGSCYFDSVPAVFVTGQVNSYELRGNRGVRQLGFQETDIVAMASPITKGAWQVSAASAIPDAMDRAFRLAVEGRPGPVLLDVTMDAQRAIMEDAPPRAAAASPAQSAPNLRGLEAALHAARRPLVLAGGGVRAASAAAALRAFVELHDLPVVESLMAVDALPTAHPLRVGMIGSYGNRWANLAIDRSDFILVLGSRLDIRQTGAQPRAFKGSRVMYHVDVDASEINNRVEGCEPIVTDLRAFFRAAESLQPAERSRAEWHAHLRQLREQWPDTAELQDCRGINPNIFMHQLSTASRQAGAFVVDVGQHQMWAAQSLDLRDGQRFLTSGGMGAMGFALPAGVGAATTIDEPVVVIAGDGGSQVNLQELQTVAHHGLALKIVVLNNESHGMVRQFQKSYFEGRYIGTVWGYSAPDFAAVAKVFGISSATVRAGDAVEAGLALMWADPRSPFLLQVAIDPATDVFPKLAFGRTIADMEPFSQPIEMEST